MTATSAAAAASGTGAACWMPLAAAIRSIPLNFLTNCRRPEAFFLNF